jgi:hypothetical protein
MIKAMLQSSVLVDFRRPRTYLATLRTAKILLKKAKWINLCQDKVQLWFNENVNFRMFNTNA